MKAGGDQVADGRALTLYGRADCCLCDEARALVAPLCAEFGVALRELDIDGDSELQRRFFDRIPVLTCGEELIAELSFDHRAVRRRIEQIADIGG